MSTPALNLTGVLEPPPSPAAPSSRSVAARAPLSVDPRLDSFVNDVTAEASRRTGYTYRLGDGPRTPEQQAEKVARGYSKTYNSKHLSGHARDVLAFDSSGRYITDGASEAYNALGDVYREKAASAGLPIRWGGDFKDFHDPGHFEIDGDASPAPALKLDGVLEPPLKLDGILEPAADDDVISTNARPVVEPAPQAAPAPSHLQVPDLQTVEGRQARDARNAQERSAGAYLDVSVPVSDVANADGSRLVQDAYKSAVVARGVTPEFFDKWEKENNPTGYHITDRPGGTELTADDAYDESSKAARLRLDANHVSKIVDDYKASRGSLTKLEDWATSDGTSPGEKFVDAAGTLAKPVAAVAGFVGRPFKAGSAAFWTGYNTGSPSKTYGAAWEALKGNDPGEAAKNAIGEAARGSQTLASINPRLPALAGFAADTVADPANLIPLGMVGKVGKLGRLAEGAEAVGMLNRGFVEARPLGLLEEAAAREAASAPDDLLRSADYSVERLSVPHNTAGGAPVEAWKVTDASGDVSRPAR
jgi:peptidoglycan L-alanyl-D-glutamate endopeptidase CwlK